MATTYTLPLATFIAAGIDGLSFELDPTEFSNGVLNSEGTEILYKHLEGSPATPSTIRSGCYPKNKAGTTNRSMKLTTTGIKTTGDGVETPFSYSWTIAEADGSDGNLSAEERLKALLGLVSVLTRSSAVSGDVFFSLDVLQRQVFGECDVLHITPASLMAIV